MFHTVIEFLRFHLLIFAFDFQSRPTALSSSWKQQGLAIFGDSAYDNLGTSVALSADARTLVVGATGEFINTDKKG